MNEYDSQKLFKLLEPGYEAVRSVEEADLVVINTCSVRDKPEQKLYSVLGELAEIKRQKPSLMVGVGGCVAQQEGNAIVARSKNVDFVFGTHNLSLVPALIERRRLGAGPQVAVDYRDEWEELPLGFSGKERVSVFVAISRGCNKNCSYCIVPTTRGVEVSRAEDEIVREIRLAVHRGAREVVLLGQTVNSWGRDLSPRKTFVHLLERLSEIDQLLRIRFTSPHPQEIREDFCDAVISNPKICRHIHMPLQSGSNRILKAMNRNYRRERYLDIVGELRSRVPDIGITTDIIVGFPGEQEEDFLQTLDVLEQVQFDSSYSFMFSPRPGTEAERMSDQVEPSLKAERLKRFQARQDEITAERLSAAVGSVKEVLIDGPSQHDSALLHGKSSQNISVNLSASGVPEYGELSPGDLVAVNVTSAARFTLKAEPIAVIRGNQPAVAHAVESPGL